MGKSVSLKKDSMVVIVDSVNLRLKNIVEARS